MKYIGQVLILTYFYCTNLQLGLALVQKLRQPPPNTSIVYHTVQIMFTQHVKSTDQITITYKFSIVYRLEKWWIDLK